jgi:hypothetical protein
MKKYDITISTSQAYKLEIEADTEQEALDKANLLSTDEIVEQSYDYSEVDGFPMIVSAEEVACDGYLAKKSKQTLSWKNYCKS